MNTSSSEFTTSADEELFEIARKRRQPKLFKRRKNYFEEYSESEFFERFRLTKEVVEEILNQIKNDLKYDSLRNKCFSPMQQLLLTLRFFAIGCMLISVGDYIGVTKATAGWIIKRVSAIAQLQQNFIKMPSTDQEIKEVQAGFYEIAKFPKVIGAIDCTHIKIQSPGKDDAEVYRNRKGYFSYNVQTICDSNLKITNLIARWPGSTHDQTIFNNCRLKAKFDSGEYKNWFLLGDNGYRNCNYLLTPLLNTSKAAEELYNRSHIKTRNTVERQYGVWKRRFPILSLGIRVNTDLAKIIVVATAVLHNIVIDMNVPLPVNEEVIAESNEIVDDNTVREFNLKF